MPQRMKSDSKNLKSLLIKNDKDTKGLANVHLKERWRINKGKYYHLNQDQDDADTQKADLLAP